ncbi:MAG: hypothetical protein E7680_05300 [Ruminococcaceae bacterium]|nr:hypothetical protein [Oscillospiraceae bacterium]
MVPKTAYRSWHSLRSFDHCHSNSRPLSAPGGGWLFSPLAALCAFPSQGKGDRACVVDEARKAQKQGRFARSAK